MKTIEELKKERDEYIDKSSMYSNKANEIEKEIMARTSDEVNMYIGKYLRTYADITDKLGYSRYLYVKTAEKDYDCGWVLKGIGFTIYHSESQDRQIYTTDNYIGINLKDIFEHNYYKLEELTKEQFYEARNTALKIIMEEEYV